MVNQQTVPQSQELSKEKENPSHGNDSRSKNKAPAEENRAEPVIAKEREVLGLDNATQPVGVAFSGGGIRSASFSIGVLQALQGCVMPETDRHESSRRTLFNYVDYLSTVSGGGYAGTSLSWFRYNNGEGFFPFGIKGEGSQWESRKDDAQTPDPAKILTFIRLHGNYLTPNGWLDFTSMLGTLIRGLLISASFYFLFLVLVTSLLYRLSLVEAVPALAVGKKLIALLNGWLVSIANYLFPEAGIIPQLNAGDEKLILLGVLLAVIAGLAFLLMTFAPILFTIFKVSRITQSPLSYWGRTLVQGINGLFIKLMLLAILIISLPFVYRLFAGALQIIGPAGIITGLLAAYARFRTFTGKVPLLEKSPRAGTFFMVLSAAIFIYTLLLFSYGITTITLISNGSFNTVSGWPLVVILVIVLVGYGLLVNINYCAVGRMYRDRLMETFLPDNESVNNDTWGLAEDAEKTTLDTFCLAGQGNDQTAIRPYQLINSNVVLVSDKDVRNRDRGGASFLLSPLFVGSDATGYRRTNDYMKNGIGITYRGLTGATAMAISGAAVNPNTGVAGSGPTRNVLISFLMTFFNIRLGYWGQNPGDRFFNRPNLIYPGLFALFSVGYHAEAKFLDLSDGGHFENLGLYELLRRRCRFIIASDATADPDFNFTDLGNAIERARVDFGITTRFSDGEYDLEHLIPGTAGHSVFQEKFELAKRGFAFGNIYYPKINDKPAQEGLLIYVKSTMTSGLPGDIYGYKARHPEFPDQSTADQFFDETQFEAYRELGYEITKSVFTDKLVMPKVEKYLQQLSFVETAPEQ